jgi:hypothetical protein
VQSSETLSLHYASCSTDWHQGQVPAGQRLLVGDDVRRQDAIALNLLADGATPTASAHQYKMTTQIPESIPIPDQLETRFGTLNFVDGFPDDASTEKLYDNLDFQRKEDRRAPEAEDERK